MKILKRFQIALYVSTIALLTLISSWRALFFHFWRDDWVFLDVVMQSPIGLLRHNPHPATGIEDWLLMPLFGWNPIYWNILGILLRIVACLSFSFMMKKITSSPRIAILSGIFMASSPAGLETVGWSSVHVVPLVIVLLSIGVGLWFYSLPIGNLGTYFMSLLLIVLAFVSDPPRVVLIAPLILLFSLVNIFFSERKKMYIKKFLYRYLLLLLLFFVFYLSALSHIKGPVSFEANLKMVHESPVFVLHFFNAIGNLITGNVYFPQVHNAGGYFNQTLSVITILFFGLFLLVSISWGLLKKSKNAFLICIFLLWILALYLPNWLFAPWHIATADHRYLQISSMGQLAILAIIVSQVKKPYFLTAIIFILILNLYASNRILLKDSEHRSISSVKRLWSQVLHDRPISEYNDVFYFTGDEQLIESHIEVTLYNQPYIILSGMKDRRNAPTVITPNKMDLSKYFCAQGDKVINFYWWEIRKSGTTLLKSELNRPAKYFLKGSSCPE